MDNLESLLSAMAALSVSKFFFKRLKKNNNSKNQFYLAGSLGVLQDIPAGEYSASAGTSMKPGGRGASILKAPLDLRWMDDAGNLAPAPAAQIILYPQYPEVRLSGLLEGCPSAPPFLADATEGRFLFLGVSGRMVMAYACDAGSPLAGDLERGLAARRWPGRKGALVEVPMPGTAEARDALKSMLLEISGRGWIPSQMQAERSAARYSAQNGGGYTLESQFGIRPNGASLPDFLGWEIKASTTRKGCWPWLNCGQAITLMTPEPTCGMYCGRGGELNAFCERFCLPDKGSEAKRHFRQPFSEVGLSLAVKRDRSADDGVYLAGPDGEIAAGWSYGTLLTHWTRKHRRAVYVPFLRRTENGLDMYRYSPVVRLCEETTVELFLDALAAGTVYCDPGAKFELGKDGAWRRTHPRNQFRVQAKNLWRLYASCADIDLRTGMDVGRKPVDVPED